MDGFKTPHAEELDYAGELPACHQEFLLARHGTSDLVPLPSQSVNDPLNWPSWRKNVNIVLVSFHAMMCLLMGACIIPALKDMGEAMGVSSLSNLFHKHADRHAGW